MINQFNRKITTTVIRQREFATGVMGTLDFSTKISADRQLYYWLLVIIMDFLLQQFCLFPCISLCVSVCAQCLLRAICNQTVPRDTKEILLT
jgi:hypothetical protein